MRGGGSGAVGGSRFAEADRRWGKDGGGRAVRDDGRGVPGN